MLPSAVTEYKHSHVMVRWFDVCFSSVPPAADFVNKAWCGAPTLEIACTFDLFKEQTFMWKIDEASRKCGLGAYGCAHVWFLAGLHMCIYRLSEARGSLPGASVKQLVRFCSIWAVHGLSVWQRRCHLRSPYSMSLTLMQMMGWYMKSQV